MLQPLQRPTRRGAGRIVVAPLAVVAGLLTTLVFPLVSYAAPQAAMPAATFADPDTGYWIELIIVAVITAVAGIVFNVRHKPDP